MIPVWKKYGIGIVMLLGLLFIYSIYLLTINRLGDFDTLAVTQMALAVCGMGLCVMLILTFLLDTKIDLGAIFFLVMVIADFFALMTNLIDASFIGSSSYAWLITISQYANPALIYSIMLFSWMYIAYISGPRERMSRRFDAIIIVIFVFGMAILFVNIFTGYLFTVTKDAVLVYGPLKWLLLVPTVAMVVVGIFGTYALVRGKRKKLALAVLIMAPVTSMLLDLYFSPVGTTNVVFCLALLIIYGNFYVGRSQELILKEAELMEQRAKILISQIQPHFLYNSLTSIMNIKGNPPATREAISEFGLYLRGNMDSLKKSGPVMLRDELDHVETFIILQKLEWGDKLGYKLDIKVKDILVPAQTIQILVAYCIDYGLKPSDGGTIYVNSWIAGSNYVITVGHDGKRFDTSALDQDDSTYPGEMTFNRISNRLADLVGGKIEMFRRDGGGNLFRILIPIPRKTHMRPSYQER